MGDFKGVTEKFSVDLVSDDGYGSQRVRQVCWHLLFRQLWGSEAVVCRLGPVVRLRCMMIWSCDLSNMPKESLLKKPALVWYCLVWHCMVKIASAFARNLQIMLLAEEQLGFIKMNTSIKCLMLSLMLYASRLLLLFAGLENLLLQALGISMTWQYHAWHAVLEDCNAWYHQDCAINTRVPLLHLTLEWVFIIISLKVS